MKEQLNKSNESGRAIPCDGSSVKSKPKTRPNVIAIKSFSGKRMTQEEADKFVDGALTIAEDAARSFPEQMVIENEPGSCR